MKINFEDKGMYIETRMRGKTCEHKHAGYEYWHPSWRSHERQKPIKITFCFLLKRRIQRLFSLHTFGQMYFENVMYPERS